MFKSEKYFFIPFAFVWVGAWLFLLIVGKIDSHLMLNNYHTTYFDIFFKHFTAVGGWVPCAVAGILLLFRKWKITIVILASQLTATLITTPLKRIIRAPRPSIIFNDLGIDFPIVEGVDLHSTLSMPSGHTSAVFAFCFSLALFCPKWWQKMLCLLLAILVGYSRIYLSQHFLADVLAGSIVGIIAVLILIPLITKLKETK
ncbi:MAG: phosphatase PAP2 family protein [Paludibacteraceae bacterium]|nr:phosphatase PAP2 family protein [Paludibacteraceae bacterium]